MEFGVNTEYSKSSSTSSSYFVKLTSSNTSNSGHVSNELLMDVYRLCFVSPIKHYCCPPHQGALERLNFQIIFFFHETSRLF